MLRLRGNSPATVDEKGRIKLPSSFKSALDSHYSVSNLSGLRFYLTSTDGRSARLYPLPVWEGIEDKLSGQPSTLESVRRYLEITSYFGLEIEPDSQGRFVIQPILRSRANLAGEVLILGQMNYLSIWNRPAFEARIDEDALTAAHLDQLASLGIG